MGITIEGNVEGKPIYLPYHSSVGIGDVILRLFIASLIIVIGLYASFLAAHAYQIAFDNDAGLHFIYLLSSFSWVGAALVLCGVLFFILPVGYRSIPLVVAIFLIALVIGLGEYKIVKYGYSVPNYRVFSHRFMHVQPPIANHDGYDLQERANRNLNEIRELYSKQLQQFLAK